MRALEIAAHNSLFSLIVSECTCRLTIPRLVKLVFLEKMGKTGAERQRDYIQRKKEKEESGIQKEKDKLRKQQKRAIVNSTQRGKANTKQKNRVYKQYQRQRERTEASGSPTLVSRLNFIFSTRITHDITDE